MVDWHALADTLAGIPGEFSMALADSLDDVDDARDLRRLAARDLL